MSSYASQALQSTVDNEEVAASEHSEYNEGVGQEQPLGKFEKSVFALISG
jgi:hypothetical protein